MLIGLVQLLDVGQVGRVGEREAVLVGLLVCRQTVQALRLVRNADGSGQRTPRFESGDLAFRLAALPHRTERTLLFRHEEGARDGCPVLVGGLVGRGFRRLRDTRLDQLEGCR